jgi:hypothetical protein
MRRLCGHIAVSLTFSGLLLWASASIGKAQPGQERADNPSTDVGPLDRLLPTIRRSHPGELSDAHGPINDASGAPHYHLKWITPGGMSSGSTWTPKAVRCCVPPREATVLVTAEAVTVLARSHASKLAPPPSGSLKDR